LPVAVVPRDLQGHSAEVEQHQSALRSRRIVNSISPVGNSRQLSTSLM